MTTNTQQVDHDNLTQKVNPTKQNPPGWPMGRHWADIAKQALGSTLDGSRLIMRFFCICTCICICIYNCAWSPGRGNTKVHRNQIFLLWKNWALLLERQAAEELWMSEQLELLWGGEEFKGVQSCGTASLLPGSHRKNIQMDIKTPITDGNT